MGARTRERERESKGRTLIAALVIAIFLALPAGLRAVAICDSTNGSCGRNGVSTSQSHDVSVTAASAFSNEAKIPVGTIIVWHSDKMPEDADKWLECNGQEVKQSDYPLLYALMHNTPNYTGQFLRGGGSSDVGRTAEDTIKSHTSIVPSHDHTFSVLTEGMANSLYAEGYMDVYVPKGTSGTDGGSSGISSSGGGTSSSGSSVSNMEKTFMSVYLCSLPATTTATRRCNSCSTSNITAHDGNMIDCSNEKVDISVQRALASTQSTVNYLGYECESTYFSDSGSYHICPSPKRYPINVDYQTGKIFCPVKNCTKDQAIKLNLAKITNELNALKIAGGISKVKYLTTSYSSSLENLNTIRVPILKEKSLSTADHQIQGKTDKAPQLKATYTGGAETAPRHIYVRYLIRAKN